MSPNSVAKSNLLTRIGNIVGNSAWVALGLFGFASAAILLVFGILPHQAREYLTDTTAGILLLSALQYVAALSAVVGIPLLIRHWTKREAISLKHQLGIAKQMPLRYLAIVPAVWVVYFVLSNIAVALATLIPGFNVDQAQDIGFDNVSSSLDLIIAFVGLVIVAPIAEELLFRGYLFGKLRGINGLWVSAIVTSLVFGAVHGQWNVGIDTFVLSLFLCFLREKSGSIWPGVWLHGLKNAVAYFFIFIAPILGINLLQ